MKKSHVNLAILCLTFLLVGGYGCQEEASRDQAAGPDRPNIVIILADDLGWGDVRAYNPDSKIPTPHMDSLAGQGMRFTDAHSSASVCSPTRYGLMTGRYSWRTRLKRGVLWPPAKPLIDSSRTTIASLLQQAGYYTSIVGKWHLGLDWVKVNKDSIDYNQPLKDGPNDHGFDESFIFAGSADMKPYTYIENGRVTQKPTGWAPGGRFGQAGPSIPGLRPEDIMPRFTQRAKWSIDQHAKKRSDRPLFLYFPLTAPHKPVAPSEKFQGKTDLGDYGDFVYQVDWTVGQVIDRLKKHDMFKNTLLIVTSDNGTSPNAAEQAIEMGHDANGPWRGLKAQIWEGGHRVPFIATWLGQITPDTVSSERISLVDFMATFAALTDQQLGAADGVDSYNILPVLQGKSYKKPIRNGTVVRSGGGCLGMLQDNWKIANCPGSGSGWSGSPTTGEAKEMGLPPVQLYKLSADTGESENLQAQRPEKVKQLRQTLSRYIDQGRSTPGPKQQNWKGKSTWRWIEGWKN